LHAIETGLSPRSGAHNPNATLTTPDVLRIRELLKTGLVSLAEIAAMFGVQKAAIQKIKNGRTWKHI
jgi:hypothetical protein